MHYEQFCRVQSTSPVCESSPYFTVGLKSVIWNYFVKGDESGKFVKEDTYDKPVFKLCKKPVLAKRSNKTNLFYHLHKNLS